MRIAVTSGLAGTASLIAGIVVPMMVPQIEPWVGYSLLAAAAFMFLMALALWLPARKSPERLGNGQTTQGDSSPAITGSTFNGPVHFAPHTAHSPLPPPERARPPIDTRQPDTRLPQLINHLSDVIERPARLEGVPFDEFENLVIPWMERVIMDAIGLNDLAIWGRQGHSSLGRLRWLGPGTFTLSLQEGVILQRKANARYFESGLESSDLHFSAQDIARIWPHA